MSYADLGLHPFPVYKTISLHQLTDEISKRLGPVEVVMESGYSKSKSSTKDQDQSQNLKIKCTVWVGPVKALEKKVDLVAQIIREHRPVLHYGYSDDLVKMHNSWIRLLTGTLSVDDHGDALRAMALVLRGDLPDCACSKPLER